MNTMKFYRPLADGTIQVGRIKVSTSNHWGKKGKRRPNPQEATRVAHKQGWLTKEELGAAAFVGKRIVE